MTSTATTPTLRWDEITPDPRNVRADALHDVADMAESIKVNGVLQPLTINMEGTTIVGGHRRHAAIGLLIDSGALERSYPIPVHFLTDVHQDAERSTLQLMLVENMQRVDLNPVEEAHAFDELKGEFELTQKQIAERIGKSASLVSARLRLLKLPEVALTALVKENISLDQAEEMVPLAAYPDMIEQILANPGNYSARAIKQMVDRVKLQEKVESYRTQIGELGATGVSAYSELQELNRQSSGEMIKNPTKAELKKFVVAEEIYYLSSDYEHNVMIRETMTFDSTNDKSSTKQSEDEKKAKLARKERNAAIATLVSETNFSNAQVAELAELYVLTRASAAAHKLACSYLGLGKEDVPGGDGYYQWDKGIEALVLEGGKTAKQALAAMMLAEFELREAATRPPHKEAVIAKALAPFGIGLTRVGGPKKIKVEPLVEATNEGDEPDGGTNA